MQVFCGKFETEYENIKLVFHCFQPSDEIARLVFNLISLANNHVMDKGEDAVLYSNSYWKSKNKRKTSFSS